MKDERSTAGQEWQVTWVANRQAQLTGALSASPAQRLAWLEDAIEFAYRARRSRKRHAAPPSRKS